MAVSIMGAHSSQLSKEKTIVSCYYIIIAIDLPTGQKKLTALLTDDDRYIDELTVQLVRLRANGHILTNVTSINFQTN